MRDLSLSVGRFWDNITWTGSARARLESLAASVDTTYNLSLPSMAVSSHTPQHRSILTVEIVRVRA